MPTTFVLFFVGMALGIASSVVENKYGLPTGVVLIPSLLVSSAVMTVVVIFAAYKGWV